MAAKFPNEPIIEEVQFGLSQAFKIPVQYVIRINGRLTSLYVYMNEQLSRGVSLQDIYVSFNQKFKVIDIAGLYSQMKSFNREKVLEFYSLHQKDVDTIDADITSFMHNFSQKIELEEEIIRKIEEYNVILSGYSTQIPPMMVTENTLQYGVEITIEDGLQVFNHTITTDTIPYIQWNSESDLYFRIHANYSKEENVMIDKKPHRIIFKLNYEDDILTGIIDLAKGTLSLESNNVDREIITRNIRQSFPTLKLTTFTLSNIKAAMSYNIPLDYMSFLEAILSPLESRIFQHFLLIKEQGVAQADKNQMKLFFRAYNAKLDRQDSSIMFTIEEASNAGFKVNIQKSRSEIDLKYFAYIFSRLILIYKNNRDRLKGGMALFGVPYQDSQVEVDQNSQISKIATLKKKRPDIFSGSYNTSCQCSYQPVIIDEKEVADWTSLTTPDGGQRQVAKFPPDDAGHSVANQFYFVCPDDVIPYPVLQPNTRGTNQKEVPYFPCCHKKPDGISAELYWDVVKNRKTHTSSAKQKNANPLVSPKILSRGSQGVISKNLSDLLNSRTPDAQRDFRRHWVLDSPSSLLHAVYQAFYPTVYDEANNRDLIEQINGIRKKLFDEIHPAVYRQELYDWSDEKIISVGNDLSQLLLPEYFYRGVEELFNVNIVVFRFTEKDNLELDLPRTKSFYIRNIDLDRQTILIIKNFKKQEEPHCELIIDNGSLDRTETGRNFIHGKNITKIVKDLFDREINYRVWTIPGVIGSEIADQYIQERNSPFSILNWKTIIQFDAMREQWIDDNGKCIGINFAYGASEVTIFIPPTIPFNLPEATGPHHVIPMKLARQIFKTRESGRSSRGLWFPILDYQWGIFVPSTGESAQPDVPEYSLVLNEASTLDRYRLIKKRAKILTKMIARCWQIDQTDGWFERFVVNDKSLEEKPYEPIKINEIIPAVSGTEELITLFSSWWPPYFQEGKIHLSPKLYTKIRSFLEKFARDTRGLPTVETIFLSELYEEEQDFIPCDKSIVLIGENKFMAWHYHRDDIISIKKILTQEDQNISEPVIYRDEHSGRSYIIQNFFQSGDNISRALNCSIQWKQKSYNTSDTEDLPYKGYIVYRIGSKGNAVISEIVPPEAASQDLPEILQYSEHRYAAMLPL